MQGLMQDVPLLISSLIRHADRHHGQVEIVSRRVEGDIHRTTYRQLHTRARQLANALDTWGVGMGERIATLAWNGHRHMELYYAVAGKGAIVHTINPRLHTGTDRVDRQSRRGQRAVLRPHLPAGHRKDRRAMQDGEALRADDRPRAHASDDGDPQPALLRRHAGGRVRRIQLAGVRREHGVVDLLHLGHHRSSQGRALQPPLDAAAYVRRGVAGHAQYLGQGRDPAGCADVPRQRVGNSLRRRHGRREAGVPGRGARWQVAATNSSRAKR